MGPGGRFAARGDTLVLLIQRAYGVMDWNVAGGPGWIRDDRFDVNAKANVPGNLTEPRGTSGSQAAVIWCECSISGT